MKRIDDLPLRKDFFEKPYCPLCRSFLSENEIVSTVHVSRGREYQWKICFRCNCPVQMKKANTLPGITATKKFAAEAAS